MSFSKFQKSSRYLAQTLKMKKLYQFTPLKYLDAINLNYELNLCQFKIFTFFKLKITLLIVFSFTNIIYILSIKLLNFQTFISQSILINFLFKIVFMSFLILFFFFNLILEKV